MSTYPSTRCCCTASFICDYCSSQSSFTAPLSEVARGITPLVADRNGNGKRLAQNAQALLSSNAGGTVQMRNGAVDDPILLGLLQTLLDGKGALVRNGQGVIGMAVPAGDDLYLAYVGGVVQWVSTIPRSNVFDPDDLQPQSGRMVTVGCQINGMLSLGYIDLGTNDYLYSVDGIVRGKGFCDAPDATDADSILVCSDGVLSKIGGTEGDVLKIGSGNKLAFASASLGINPITPYLIACKVLGTGIPNGQESWSNSGSPIGSFDVTTAGIPNTAQVVQVRGISMYDINAASTSVNAYVKCNGILVSEVIGFNFGEVSDRDSGWPWVTVTNNLFTYELGCTSSNTAQGSVAAKLQIYAWA